MNKLLIITGDLATGKTTFAKSLSERYGIAYFDKDTVKEILGDTVGFTNREENKRLSVASTALMEHIFDRFSALGLGLILEANYHEGEIDALLRIAEKRGYEVLTLDLSGSADKLYPRYCRRIREENRHPVHLCNTIDDRESYEAYIKNSRNFVIPGRVISVNADDFSYQRDAALLSRLDDFFTSRNS